MSLIIDCDPGVDDAIALFLAFALAVVRLALLAPLLLSPGRTIPATMLVDWVRVWTK